MKTTANACLKYLVSLQVFVCAASVVFAQHEVTPTQDPSGQAAQQFTMTTRVNRVVLDVVVTDAHGEPVRDLTQKDFTVTEDGKKQDILSFDIAKMTDAMDYTPPKLGALPKDTFVDLPRSPERGPLFILYYDLVNIPLENQVFARQQIVKFVESSPEGARFAIFVSTDGIHMIQGFTSNREELYAAIDPRSSRLHLPEQFMMGVNFGQNDELATASRLNYIGRYLSGLPGRKNLIWLSSMFPLSLFPSKDDTEVYREEVKRTLELLARNQIAVYPVDVSGVVLTEVYAPQDASGSNGISTDSRDSGIVTPGTAPVVGNAPAAAPAQEAVTAGYSVTDGSYQQQDEIARVTGGKAVYSSNDVMKLIKKVTDDGGNYYTLTYSPTNKNYDGSLRRIHVDLAERDYHLSYRRAYYGTDPDTVLVGTKQSDGHTPPEIKDSFSALMEHGAPSYHQLVFGAHVRALGPLAMGTKEQMAEIFDGIASTPTEKHKTSSRPIKPVSLQPYAIDYTVMAPQFRSAGETAPNLEIAAAFYDAEGKLLNSTANRVKEQAADSGGREAPKDAYRMEQRLDAPAGAKFLRMAVRDANTNKVGVMEIPLPLKTTS